VENYVRFRPGYPAALVHLLARESALTPDSTIADLGSGTGLLSTAFLSAGYSVLGIEPNREMRLAGDALLAAYHRYRSIDATAESTTLPDQSVHLAVAGQAFHWFQVDKARREWSRILKPAGIAALIWNERHTASPFMREVEDLIDNYATAFDKDGSIREGGRGRIGLFFGPSPFHLDEFPNTQQFGLEGLLGRVASISYVPHATDPQYPEMAAALARLLDRYQRDGQVSFEYRTKVYWGTLTPAD
jgi:SAM-dependent methyltransferase